MNENTRLIEVADEYIYDIHAKSGLDWVEWLQSQRDYYRANASHLGDCFCDTMFWAEGEDFSADDLEAEIVRQVMGEAGWNGEEV